MSSNKKKLIPSIVIFLIGVIITIIGALFKIQHWPYGSEILLLGNVIEILGIVLAIFTLIKIYKSKS